MSVALFPDGTFDPRPELDALTARWLGAHLVAHGEGPLASLETGDVLRLLVLPSRSAPIVVRAHASGSVVTHDARKSREAPLSPASWADLAHTLELAAFFTLPSDNGRSGHDGFQLLLEARRGGKARSLQRFGPSAEPMLTRLSEKLLELGGADPSLLRV